MTTSIEQLQDLVKFWSDLADKRQMQLEIAKKTLKSIADYSEHGENDCCGGLSESALNEIAELESWENYLNKKKGC